MDDLPVWMCLTICSEVRFNTLPLPFRPARFSFGSLGYNVGLAWK